MALDEFLENLREGEMDGSGHFTVAAERARALMAGKALADPSLAWLCLAQGLISAGAVALEIAVSRRAATWIVEGRQRMELVDLLRHERFLLGWLNLGWFGSPHWSAAEGLLMVEWKGNPLVRHRHASSLEGQLAKALIYSPVPVKIGRSQVVKNHLPVGCPLSLYPLPKGRPGGLRFADDGQDVPGFFERRRFSLDAMGQAFQHPPGPGLAAFVGKSKAGHSHITWVHQGAIVSQERGGLDRPGIALVACVESLGLETDLSGFSVVSNDACLKFKDLIRRDVLWML
jgi:hypothetical protein